MPSPAEQFAQSLLQRAILENASDLHLEPFEKSFRIRLRTPSGFVTLPSPDPALFPSLVRYFKLLSHLDIAVENLPQDGKFTMSLGSGTVEFRLSALPTVYGPSLVLRVLDRERTPLSLDTLGFDAAIIAELRRALALPFGLIAVVGTTGSGKTTTLYAALRELAASRTKKILSVEDPIEYALHGVQQVAVGGQISFASALRSFLRHDPDIIFVGEIRDSETAQLAIRAALTGHLVLTTLHAGSADEVSARLTDLGVDALLHSALKFILAQSLHSTSSTSRQPVGHTSWPASPIPAHAHR